MLQLSRLFSTAKVKGTRDYINTQKKFEILRTLIYFILPIGLFVIGLITTKTKMNLLTVVAVVGCLPASKSLIGAIMFLRYKSCPRTDADQIDTNIGNLKGLYDMVFTSYQINFPIDHLVVHGYSICCYCSRPDFPEKEFQVHIESILKTDGHKGYTIKVFRDIHKYTERLVQLNQLESENKNTPAVIETLKSVAL